MTPAQEGYAGVICLIILAWKRSYWIGWLPVWVRDLGRGANPAKRSTTYFFRILTEKIKIINEYTLKNSFIPAANILSGLGFELEFRL